MEKYKILTGSKHSVGRHVEGFTSFETIEQLILKCNEIKDKSIIKRVGLTYTYLNSLSYKVRKEVERKDYLELQTELKKANIEDEFVNMMVEILC